MDDDTELDTLPRPFRISSAVDDAVEPVDDTGATTLILIQEDQKIK